MKMANGQSTRMPQEEAVHGSETSVKLSKRDYISWVATVIILFLILISIPVSTIFRPLGPQTRIISSLYTGIFYGGMGVSAIFVGSLIWIVIRFREKPSAEEHA